MKHELTNEEKVENGFERIDANTEWIDTDLAMGGMIGITESEPEGRQYGGLSHIELARLQFAAEHPDLADPIIATLPKRHFTLKGEAALTKRLREELRREHAQRAEQHHRVILPGGQLSLKTWTG